MKDALEELSSVAKLEADWDGEGAEKPSSVAVANAHRFLETLSRAGEPMMSACADGSVDAYWKTADGITLMNFNAKGKIGFFSDFAGFKIKGSGSTTQEAPVECPECGSNDPKHPTPCSAGPERRPAP